MNPFEYVNPSNLEDVPGLLGRKRGRQSVVIAGGVDLLGELKDNLVAPKRLVNLKALPLKYIRHGKDGVSIGATTTLTEIVSDAKIASEYPALAQAAESVGSLQIRNVGTIGGNLCQRPRCWYYRNEEFDCLKKGGARCFAVDGNNKYNAIIGGGPSYIVHPSDLAPALIALEAQVTVWGSKGKRNLPLESFYVLPSERLLQETVLQADEVLTEVFVPKPQANTRSVYLKFNERGSMDFALSAVAAVVRLEGGVCKQARVVLGGVAPKPWRSEPAEKALVGQQMTDAVLARAAEEALAEAEPLEHNAYKVPLTKALIQRAVKAIV
ncbi:MAG: xanthine dehydrogenase family protein subunit M [bacterium]|nr:xanthine dehydrogenase family protein subunit M [bacterium]